MPSTSIQPFSMLPPNRSSLNRWLGLSLVAHVLVLAPILLHHPPILKATQLPGDKFGHYVQLSFTPGQHASSPKPQEAKAVVDRLPSLHVLPTARPTSVASHSDTPVPATAEGNDALGDGDIRIASVLVHPPPHPDLTQLPSGTRGDVVVDIVIDPTGRIASFTLSRGLGHGIDDTVLATIQNWTFQPATRNGVPVASEQELLFHYERG